MAGKLVDALGENRDLYFRSAGILTVLAEFAHKGRDFFIVQSHTKKLLYVYDSIP
jgi:hypothetical protein